MYCLVPGVQDSRCEDFIGWTQFSLPYPHLSLNQKFKQFLQVFSWNRIEYCLSFNILSRAFRIRNMRAYTMSSKRKSSNWTRGGDPGCSSVPAWRRIHKLAQEKVKSCRCLARHLRHTHKHVSMIHHNTSPCPHAGNNPLVLAGNIYIWWVTWGMPGFKFYMTIALS